MSLPDAETLRFLNDLPFFSGLPQRDIQAFADAAIIKYYQQNEAIFEQGDKAARLFIIKTGWAAIVHTLPGAPEASLVTLSTRGDILGKTAVFGGSEYPFGAQAAEDCKLIEIPGSVLTRRAKTNPDIMERVIKSISRGMRQLAFEDERDGVLTAAQRVGCLLIQLSAGIADDTATIRALQMPYAAARLGMKEETFARGLAQLATAGVKVRESMVSIESLRILAEYAGVSTGFAQDDLQAVRA